MLQLEVLILKRSPIDTDFSCSITSKKVPSLNHEVLNYSVKYAIFVALGKPMSPSVLLKCKQLIYLNSPVHNWLKNYYNSCFAYRKFSDVFGQTFLNNSILILPTGCPPIEMSK